MNFNIERDPLLTALLKLHDITCADSTLPIQSNIYINTMGDQIEFSATDLVMTIQARVHGTVKKDGAITVSAKPITDIVSNLPTGTSIEIISLEDNKLVITCTEGIYKINGLPADEFPEIPSLSGTTISFANQTLRSVIHNTLLAEEQTGYDNRHGLWVKLLKEKVEVVATNSIFLALVRCEPLKSFDDEMERLGFIIPLKSVQQVMKTFADSVELTIRFEGKKPLFYQNQTPNYISFADDETLLTTKLVECGFPYYQHILTADNTGRIVVNRKRLLQGARRVVSLSNPEHYRVMLSVEEEQLQLSTTTPELGEALEKIEIEQTDRMKPIDICINAQLLITALSHLEGDSVLIEYCDALNAISVKPISGDDRLYFIMTLKLDD